MRTSAIYAFAPLLELLRELAGKATLDQLSHATCLLIASGLVDVDGSGRLVFREGCPQWLARGEPTADGYLPPIDYRPKKRTKK